jgi:hypothetical protein
VTNLAIRSLCSATIRRLLKVIIKTCDFESYHQDFLQDLCTAVLCVDWREKISDILKEKYLVSTGIWHFVQFRRFLRFRSTVSSPTEKSPQRNKCVSLRFRAWTLRKINSGRHRFFFTLLSPILEFLDGFAWVTVHWLQDTKPRRNPLINTCDMWS